MQLLKLESGKELAGRSRGPGAPNNIEAEGRGSAQYYTPMGNPMGRRVVRFVGKSDIYIASNTSSSLAQLDVGMQLGIYQTGCENNLYVNKNN